LKGYSNLQNNCQVVAGNFMTRFQAFFQQKQLVSSLITTHNLNNYASQDSPTKHQAKHKLQLDNFLKFASRPNEELDQVMPFDLNKKINYLGTYGDERSQKLISREVFSNLSSFLQKEKSKADIKNFLQSLNLALISDNIADKSMQIEQIKLDYSTKIISRLESKSSVSSMISLELDKDYDYSFIAFLQYTMYNEIFSKKKEIREAKDALSDLRELKCKWEKKEMLKKQHMIKLGELYKTKYKLLREYKEICFYYYNNVRYVNSTKIVKDAASLYGFIIIRNPEK
jgi:hypothetical protein